MNDDFEANVRALLGTPPAPHDTAGSRKARTEAASEAEGQGEGAEGYRRTKAERVAHLTASAGGVRYEYEKAPLRSERGKKR